MLGHMTGLLFFFYVKLSLVPIFKSVDFRSCKSCILLDSEIADIIVFEKVEIFIDRNVEGYPFRPPQRYKLTKTSNLLYENFVGIFLQQ